MFPPFRALISRSCDCAGKPVQNPVILRVGCKFTAKVQVPAGTADVSIVGILASQAFGAASYLTSKVFLSVCKRPR